MHISDAIKEVKYPESRCICDIPVATVPATTWATGFRVSFSNQTSLSPVHRQLPGFDIRGFLSHFPSWPGIQLDVAYVRAGDLGHHSTNSRTLLPSAFDVSFSPLDNADVAG